MGAHHHHGHHHHGHGHHHAHAHGANETALGWAALITGAFMVVEAVAGVVSGSLALIADAGHMLTDFAALALAWFGFRLARRPADWRRTYGFDRFSVLAAFANGIALFAIAAWIVVEAAGRLMTPEPVQGGVMLSIAAMGLVVNIAAFWVLSRAQSDNLNVRAAALHVLGDLLGSVAAIVAGVVILWTGWTPIDPILSVVVALLILRSAFAVIRESGHILLEGAPADFDAREIASTLKAETPGVADVRHVHAWSITQERRMATLEVVLTESADPAAVRASIKAFLKERCGIGHVTVEIVEAPTTPSGSSDPSAGVRSILGC